jgi:para-aminobenzoate synthetase/4-amino-4-deoxychorismate lyase
MELIAGLEDTPREIYTGAIGYISPERDAQFNVAIRTAVVDKTNHRAVYGVGGGIVWDSDPEEEYLECLAKAKILSTPAVSRDFELLETILWNPAEGYFLLDEHLSRMRASAEYFAFYFDERMIRTELRNLADRLPAQRCRVRLLLQRNGQMQTMETPLSSAVDSPNLKIVLAKHPIRTDTPFVYHKTTRRGMYESALEDAGDADDVLLWNDDGYITETSIANVIVSIGGERCTPPVACGLLAGTYRAPGSELTLINSVRGEYSARLHGAFVTPAVKRHRSPSARSPSPHFRRQDY